MVVPTVVPAVGFPIPPMSSRNVAVIGAGAAGIIGAAHELRQEGHRVVVFERENQVGGTWQYMPATESDPIGVDPARNIVHSSLYASLRTNLPREVMGYRAYPFVVGKGSDRDQKRFPGHREVFEYLKDFAAEFGVYEVVRFGTEVSHVGLTEEGGWKVTWRRSYGEMLDEIYDAVVVCNGHHTEPRIAQIPGIESWPGKQIHSHNYRDPQPFQDKTVVIIGSAASAVDISRELAQVAKEVHISTRAEHDEGKLACYDNIWIRSKIKSANPDGSVAFLEGNVVSADIILYCTGYKFHFPFLETNGIVTVDDNCVGPLYKHVFPPALAPWLSFVGLPWKVVPFLLLELQSKWIAGLLSGRLVLPSPEEMMADVEAFYASMEASGVAKRYAHNLASCQFEYDDWLAAQCGASPIEEWRRLMYDDTSRRRRSEPETYRDQWEDEHLQLQAQQEFLKYFSEVAQGHEPPTPLRLVDQFYIFSLSFVTSCGGEIQSI